MQTKQYIYQLWQEVIADLRLHHPQWANLLREHGYKARIVDRKANYFGCCDYRIKKVELNIHLMHSSNKEDIIDTMKHEIAHAIDMCEYGNSSGHGRRWKNIARALGCDPRASHSNKARNIHYKYVICLHTPTQLKFVNGYNRKPRNFPIGVYLQGLGLTKNKSTKGKLIIYPWEQWTALAQRYNVGIYQEDH